MDNEDQLDNINEDQLDNINKDEPNNIDQNQLDYANEDLAYSNGDLAYLNLEEMDDDEELDENQQFDENGMPIYEEDEETIYMRRIISEKLLNKVYDDSIFNNTSVKKDNKILNKDSKKKTLSLSDLNSLMDTKIKELQPKKFISKRCSERKDTIPHSKSDKYIPAIELNKRCFNPRKVPYFFSEEYSKKMKDYNKTDNININEFPELK